MSLNPSLVLRAGWLAVVVACAALGPGCASSKASASQDDIEALRKAVKAYNEAYRWKNFERAASFLPRDIRMSFIATYEEDEKSLHIENYQILQVQMMNENAADITVRVTFTLLPSFVVQNRRLTQHWHKIGGSWILETEDNSIRELDKTAQPSNPDAFGGGQPDDSDDTKVQATDPSGAVIRDDPTPPPPPR